MDALRAVAGAPPAAGSLVLKVVLPGGHDVRRVRVEDPAGFTAAALRRRVAALLRDGPEAAAAPRGPADEQVSVAYDDDEDERVTIQTDQDFAEAVRVAKDGNRKSLRLYVTTLSVAAAGSSVAAPSASAAAGKTAATAAGKTAAAGTATTLYKPVPPPLHAPAQTTAGPASTLAGTAKNNTKKTPSSAHAIKTISKKSPETNTPATVAGVPVQSDSRGSPPKYVPRAAASSSSSSSVSSSTSGGDGEESKCSGGGVRARIEARKSAAAQAKVSKPSTTLSGGGRHDRIEAANATPASTPSKPSKPVPLKTTSGGAKLFLDGSVEFGFGGEAELRPDGSVSCLLTRTGFPSVAAQGLSLVAGKYYYELTLQTAGCIQVGWASPAFTGRADRGEGVGDDAHSWAYDGYRQRRWHGTRTESWGPKWRAGQTVCCALDCDLGVARFVLDGKWDQVPYHQAVAFTFGQGASGASGAAATVRELGGLCPAVSFSNGQRCRFNFGAPGTPFRHSPPPGGYKGVWQAWGTSDNAPPAEAASAKTRPTFTNSSVAATNPAPAHSAPAPAPPAPTAQERLAAMLCRDEVRAAISTALAHPSVSAALQGVLVALAAGELKTGAQLKRACTAQLPQLMPAIVGLVTDCPELLAVGTQLLATLVEAGVLPKAGAGRCGGGRSRHYNRCGGGSGCCGDRNRANRDANWRQQPFCEGLRRWSGKLADAVASSAQAATVAAAAAVEQVSSAAASAAGATAPAASASTSTEALVQQAIQQSAQAASERESDQIKLAVRLSLEEAEAAKALAAADHADPGESKSSVDQETVDPRNEGDGGLNTAVNNNNVDDSNPWTAVAAAPAAMPVLAAPQRATVVAVKRNGSGGAAAPTTKNNNKNNNNNHPVKGAAADEPRPRARFVKDNVPADGQRAPLAPGQRFTHSWRLVNNGNAPWPDTITARCVGGDPLLGADVQVKVPGPVQSKQPVDISVDLTAPDAPGRYISYWRLHCGETRFGDRIWVDVVVHGKEEEEEEDAVVVTAIPPVNPAPVSSDQAMATAAASAPAAAADDDDDTVAEDDNQATPQRLPTTESVSGEDSSSDSDAVGADWVAVGNIALAMSQGEPPQQQDGEATAAAASFAAEEDTSPPAAESDAEYKEDAEPTAAPAAAPPSTVGVDPVDRLISMGFDREQAVGALALNGGNVESAVAMLLGTSM